MKKMWIVVLLLAALLLAACGPAATEEPTAEPEEVEEPTAEPMPEPTAEPTAEPTPEPEPLKIGILEDQTGPLLLFGLEALGGLQLGFEYATDGTMTVAGRPIELVIRDDTSNVDTGVAAARELIESEGVEILIGNSSSAVALQVQQIADEYGVLYFAAPAASHDITGANWNEHTFRVCRDAAQDGLIIMPWAFENVGTRYMILAEDYAFGQATAAVFQLTTVALGGEILPEGNAIFAPSDTVDFTPYIQQVLENDPDGLILIWATNTTAVILFEQLATQGVTGNIPFITGFSSNDLTKLLDPGFIGSTGLIIYHYTLPQTEINDWLVERHLEEFDTYPDLFTECGFATAQAVVQALEQTGGDASPDAMIPVLEGMSFEGPKGTYTIRPEDHQALAPGYVVRLISVDDPEERFFELVEEKSAEEIAPICTAPNCGS